MLPPIYDRSDLIAMLRWQFEIGIDEALLDFPDASISSVKLDELLAPKNAKTKLPEKMSEGSTIGANPEEATKPTFPKNRRATGVLFACWCRPLENIRGRST